MLLFLVAGLVWLALPLLQVGPRGDSSSIEDGDAKDGVVLQSPSGTSGRGAPTAGDEAAQPASSAVPWFMEGRVLDPQDQPVRGAVVRASVRRGAERTALPAAPVDEQGAYRLDLAKVASWPKLVRATAYLTVYAVAQGFLPSSEQEFLLSEHALGTGWSQDHRLKRGSRVTGRVLDASGTALPDVDMGLWPLNSSAGDGCMTDAEGRYSFDVSEAGTYRIDASWGEHEVVLESLDIVIGSDVLVRDLVLPVTARFVEGIVQRTDGRSVPGVTVVSGRDEPRGRSAPDTPTAVSDDEGRFKMFLPEEGVYHLRASSLTDTGTSVECRAGDRVRIELPACRLVVRVVAPDGTPLTGADLSYDGWPASDAPPVDAWVSGAEKRDEAAAGAPWGLVGEGADQAGRETQYVDADTVWFVVARVPGGIPAEAAVRIGSGQTEAEATLVVRETAPIGTLALEVIGLDDKPISDYAVEVETLAGTSLARLRPDVNGRLDAVPAGRVRIVVQPHASEDWFPGRAPLDTFLLPIERVLEVNADAMQALALRAEAGGRFELILRGGQGRLPNMGYGSVSVRRRSEPDSAPRFVDGWIEGAGTERRRTNLWTPSGAHLNENLLEPGEYVLTVRPDALHTYEAVMRVRPGEVTQVVIDLDG